MTADNSQFSFIRDRLTPGLLITILGGLVWGIVILKTLTFETVEDRVNTKNLVDAVSIEQAYKIANHVDAEEIHMSMKVKDSLFVTEQEFRAIVSELFDDVNEINTKIYVQGKILYRIEKKMND